MNEFLKSIAPTVASALLGPLGGVAVSAIGNLLGVSEPTQQKIATAIADGKLTPEQLSAIKELELKYKADEQERGFRYAELEFKDRDSARKANVDGGIQRHMFWLSIFLLVITLGCEIAVLFFGYPDDKLPEMVVGRILGLMDAVCMMVLAYHYGTTSNSLIKTTMLAQSTPAK
jgi:hypothetical protein